MISKKDIQKVRELEIKTRQILNGSSVGGYKSRQKGFGFDFDQLRSYQYGDDIRLIDWKSSARNGGELVVREYNEERNRTFFLCLDVSASTFFGSGEMLKQDIMKQVTGALSLAAEYSKDKVGLILFSNKIEEVIYPSKGKQHIHRILEKIFTFKPSGKKSDLNVLFEHLIKKVPKRAIIFVISDFIFPDYEKMLKQAAFKKEIIAISCTDKQEVDMANIGFLWALDSETDELVLLDSRKKNIEQLKKVLKNRLLFQKRIFQKYHVDFLDLRSSRNFIYDLILFFQKRLAY